MKPRSGTNRRSPSDRLYPLLPLLAALASACNWIALGAGSVRYRTTSAGECANVAIHGTTVYGTLAERGIAIRDLTNPGPLRIVPPPPGSESIDDLAIAGTLLFVLDARRTGHLSVLSIADPQKPVVASPPVAVEVGPFSGVSAGGGRVVVSGGTSLLSLRTYDREGRLTGPVATTDLGRGQPDVLVAPDGRRAFVSTHFKGPHFGLTELAIGDPPTLTRIGAVDLDTYGFTSGGAKPASFPIRAAFAGGVVYVAHARGLAVIPVADGSPPRAAPVLDLPVKAVDVAVDGDAGAVVGSSPTPLLLLIDVARRTAPVIRATVELPDRSYPTSVAVSPSFVAVAAHEKGLLVFRRDGWSLRPERTTR